ncbi:FAD-binding and (Fe-S)-binding domain-containing protein [Sungkyunkwania multivorans]|uniref:FAD-binding and (Fe-S)-binding domain-containing protein n=1 Tax=Sungkyunkwania multivorans TaxID=1173618 RepID=A0ABW3CZ54_9FLAO
MEKKVLKRLAETLRGELLTDSLSKAIYATDASVYRKLPLAVAYPKDENDIVILVDFARKHQTSLIPRTAGTSLAGQCVGDGIVVDVSKYFTKILALDEKSGKVRVQPGVIRDELNDYLKPFGLFFGPNTSTSNRCMIGGMVGNNSSGTTSIKYGVTRDKVIQLRTILSDGSTAVFESISEKTFKKKAEEHDLEGTIYRTIETILSPTAVRKEIKHRFPDPRIHRRNTGYAIDELIKMRPFETDGASFNMCKLLAGSEGTLAFTTEIVLQLDRLPPSQSVMVAAHFDSIENCMKAVEPVMQHDLYTCEMMDKVILDCTKNNLNQLKNRFFIQGDPAAILMLEVCADTSVEALQKAAQLIATLELTGLSYAFPILKGDEIAMALELRKAGLGLLGNIVGDRKAVACIEDTAVALPDLAEYIAEFTKLMSTYDQKAVYYAHAGAGEIHLRPILNLKKAEDVGLFRRITSDVAQLVKKYNGSLSGEHGDGIVRAAFIPMMIGEKNYQLLKQIKEAFDPNNIFNPGKIVDAGPMDANFRYETDREEPVIDTLLDFSDSEGILKAAEKCNGSGDCRKLPTAGGAMCPSYHATRNEKDSTRARANALREFLTISEKRNIFDHKELKEVFDLCLSCKACASECPSNVDVATLKAEFLYQFRKAHGSSFSDKIFANNAKFNHLAKRTNSLVNPIINNKITNGILKSLLNIHPLRDIPITSSKTLNKKAVTSINKGFKIKKIVKKIYFFNDEFTKYLDTEIGLDAIELLVRLGYEVQLVKHWESGRSQISKGFLKQAKRVANKNVSRFKSLISEDTPLVGLEPSAILTFRDEYLRLADDKATAEKIAKHTYMIDEFIANEIKLGNIALSQFTTNEKQIKLHAHCHQKALANQVDTFNMLNFPKNYSVTIIPSGCCGMAGSFGYEKEHYEVSMKVGEQVLFPAVRKAPEDVTIAANGTSCRHQIKDGTGRFALHPVTILKEALLIE